MRTIRRFISVPRHQGFWNLRGDLPGFLQYRALARGAGNPAQRKPERAEANALRLGTVVGARPLNWPAHGQRTGGDIA